MPEIVSTTLDPDGRRVGLDGDGWNHVKDEHAVLAGALRDVMAAVREPALRVPGRTAGEVWYFAERAGRLPWLHVVVHYEGGRGWIVTAFPRKSLPRRSGR